MTSRSSVTRNNTPQRSIRIPDPLWADAQDVAAERGDNLSEVVRENLRAYVEQARAARPS